MIFDNKNCNRCGASIVWRHPITGQKIEHPKTNKARPLNLDGSLHLCMHKGQGEFFSGGKKIERPQKTGYFYTNEEVHY